ncbi:MAG: phosphonate ABC transporter, permease protein PhnE [Alphaproteobacteria bacterium]|nr:phosphonate ABC transporter, permease protein PhnE [Alphaproteobacteria bacterium]
MTTVDQLQAHASSLERRRRFYTGLGAAIFALLVVLGFIGAEEMNSGGFIQGLDNFFDYPRAIVVETADAGTGWFDLLWVYLPALIETINMAAVATIFGTVFAVVLSFAGTRGLQVWPPIVPVARRIMDVTRAFPELILALFLIFVLGSSPVPAIIAVAFHTAGALGKLFSEVNENIDRGPLEGMTAAGASWTKRMRWAVLPQVLPNYTSYMLLRFEINIRASAILGFVGAGGIGTELRKAISWANGADIAALFVLLFLTIMVIDQISGRLRRRLVGGMFAGAR